MADKQLQLVIVTPERTVFDEPASALRFPLFDGQIGILPGRAPLVGRLGFGELKATTASGEQSFFVDGGFVQVKGSVVSILTARAIPSADVKRADAEEALKKASALPGSSDQQAAVKAREIERARRLLSLAH
jgi:F-type H+-transporting ATPase subunit epsilon